MNRLFILLTIIFLGAIFSSYNEKKDIAEKGNKEKFKLLTMPILSPDKIIEVDRGNNNTTVCQDDKIILRPKVIYPEELYEWKDETGNVIAIGTECIINNLDTTRTYTLTIFKSDNTERVINGGFEANAYECKNTDPYNYTTGWWNKKYWTFDFSSDYGWAGTGSSALNPEKVYTIGSNPHDYHSDFANMSDHSGSGKMMIINAGDKLTDIIWAQQIDVNASTKYAFSFWGSSVHSTNPARLSFYISDGQLTSTQINQPEIYRIGEEVEFTKSTNDWNKYFKIWDSKTFSGKKWISVVNSNTIESGNDFALDDISFTGTLYETYTIRVEVSPTITGDESETIPSVCEGEEISMEMEVVGSVNEYIWEKIGETTPLTSGSDKKVFKITNPNTGDSGTYTCTAKSECGSIAKTFNLTVNKNIKTKHIKHKKSK